MATASTGLSRRRFIRGGPESTDAGLADTVHISSMVVQFRPDRLDAVVRAIVDAGGEVAATDPRGKAIAVLETTNEAAILAFTTMVGNVKGVLSANLVYHQIDEEPGASRSGEQP